MARWSDFTIQNMKSIAHFAEGIEKQASGTHDEIPLLNFLKVYCP